jgi:hypothetical protein
MALDSRSPGSGSSEVITAAELRELVLRMVGIWMSEMTRKGEIRPDAAAEEVEEFKSVVVVTLMNLFETVDGFKESLRTGRKAEVKEIIGRYLQAIS